MRKKLSYKSIETHFISNLCSHATMAGPFQCLRTGLLVVLVMRLVCANDELIVSFDGSQYIEKSLILQPYNRQENVLVIVFKTITSDGLLFYASGTSGDYIALELVHGKIR